MSPKNQKLTEKNEIPRTLIVSDSRRSAKNFVKSLGSVLHKQFLLFAYIKSRYGIAQVSSDKCNIKKYFLFCLQTFPLKLKKNAENESKTNKMNSKCQNFQKRINCFKKSKRLLGIEKKGIEANKNVKHQLWNLKKLNKRIFNQTLKISSKTQKAKMRRLCEKILTLWNHPFLN